MESVHEAELRSAEGPRSWRRRVVPLVVLVSLAVAWWVYALVDSEPYLLVAPADDRVGTPQVETPIGRGLIVSFDDESGCFLAGPSGRPIVWPAGTTLGDGPSVVLPSGERLVDGDAFSYSGAAASVRRLADDVAGIGDCPAPDGHAWLLRGATPSER